MILDVIRSFLPNPAYKLLPISGTNN